MKFRTTLILLLLCAGLGLWVWRDLNRARDPDPSQGPLLSDFPQHEVTRVELERTEPAADGALKRLRIRFEKRGETWWLLEPLEALADARAVQMMIDRPCTNWSSASVVAAEDLEKFGLGGGAPRLTLGHPKGEARVRIGRRTEYEKSVYAWVEGEERVRLMDPNFAEPYLKPVESYRLPAEGSPGEKTKTSPPAAPTK